MADYTLYQFAQLCANRELSSGFENATLENLPVKLMLVVTEISEAIAEHRKVNLDITHLNEEIVDAIIRLFAIAGALQIDVEQEALAKIRKNATRGIRHGKRY